MTASETLNFVGLCFVTTGALGAIFCAPAPTYHRDGSIGLTAGKKDTESEEAFRRRRIRIHFYQKWGLRASFGLIALSSILQGYAALQ